MPAFDFGPVPPPPLKASPTGYVQRTPNSGRAGNWPGRDGYRGGHTAERSFRAKQQGPSNNFHVSDRRQNSYRRHNRGHGAMYDAQRPSTTMHAAAARPLLQPVRVDMAAAPSVPDFGFIMPSVALPSHDPIQAHHAHATKRRRLENTLGITPRSEDALESGDDIDEEVAFAQEGGAEVLNTPGIFFKTAAERIAWLAERRKRYPTAARREAAARDKPRALRASIAPDRHTKTLPNGAPIHLIGASTLPAGGISPAGGVPSGRTRVSGLDLPRQDLHVSLLGSAYDSDSGDDSVAVKGPTPEQHAATPVGHGQSLENAADAAGAEDERGPDSESSKIHEYVPMSRPPSDSLRARAPPPTELIPFIRKGYCRYFLEKGFCKFQASRSCRFIHKIPHALQESRKPKRSSLFDKLVQQELYNERMVAVRAIKSLAASGYFTAA